MGREQESASSVSSGICMAERRGRDGSPCNVLPLAFRRAMSLTFFGLSLLWRVVKPPAAHRRSRGRAGSRPSVLQQPQRRPRAHARALLGPPARHPFAAYRRWDWTPGGNKPITNSNPTAFDHCDAKRHRWQHLGSRWRRANRRCRHASQGPHPGGSPNGLIWEAANTTGLTPPCCIQPWPSNRTRFLFWRCSRSYRQFLRLCPARVSSSQRRRSSRRHSTDAHRQPIERPSLPRSSTPAARRPPHPPTRRRLRDYLTMPHQTRNVENAAAYCTFKGKGEGGDGERS